MDWDRAYDNRAAIADSADYPPRWARDAAEFRSALGARARLDLAYGPAPRERLDLFLPAATPAGLAVFVHGGYWRTFAKSDWSHLAAGPLAHGWAVAVPGYALCPEIRVAGITRQVARALILAASEIAGPIRLAGHSAGGQLATRMLCPDADLPGSVAARIARVVSISGVHDLRPLLLTELNATLGLDLAEAEAESPALLTPARRPPVTAWVGAEELPEFRRQAALLANIWTGCAVASDLVEEPGRHHFSVVEGLAIAESALCRALLD